MSLRALEQILDPYKIVHFTTVHKRYDSRIFVKEAASAAQQWPGKTALVVADGQGNETHSGVDIRDVGALPKNRLKRFTVGASRVFSFVRKNRPKVCHFHDPELIAVFLLLRLFGQKVVMDLHEDTPRQVATKVWIPAPMRWAVSKLLGLIESVAAFAFSGVVAATPTIAEKFPERKTTLLRNFPLLSEFSDRGAALNTRGNVFGYVGGLLPERGTREMVNAIGMVSPDKNVSLELAGVFYPASLEQEVAGLPGWERTQFLGYLGRADISKMFNRMRGGIVTLHPIESYKVALPIKMFEYMASGIPVISSDFPLWREIVDGAKCGILVDPLNPQEISDAMEWIIDYPEEAKAMGERGLVAVNERYNWERESEKLTALYNKLLA